MATSIGYNYRHAPAVERARQLIAEGRLGRITNVRATFFSGYASEPKGALSWRFKRDLAGQPGHRTGKGPSFKSCSNS